VTPPALRSSHASFDLDARERKAAKVVELLELHVGLAGARVLEIGTGSGVIASSLARRVGPDGAVEAVDVVDERIVRDVPFRQVAGTALPFADGAFDVVVTNHVIEHVGDRDDQLVHLREIARVLRPRGWLYLATPSRWALVEPHFKLPLLSWLPRRLRSTYVRATGRGRHYDCDPLSRRELRALAEVAGLHAEERTEEAVAVMREVEDRRGVGGLLLGLPSPVLRAARPALPTVIVLCHRR
jgi:SAM-dependent methyltransferase